MSNKCHKTQIYNGLNISKFIFHHGTALEEFRLQEKLYPWNHLGTFYPKTSIPGHYYPHLCVQNIHYHVRILARENEERRTLSRKKNLNVTHFSYSHNCSYGLYSGWTWCPAENQGFYFIRHWCRQTTVSPYITHPCMTRGGVPLGHPTRVPHTIHTHSGSTITSKIHHEVKKIRQGSREQWGRIKNAKKIPGWYLWKQTETGRLITPIWLGGGKNHWIRQRTFENYLEKAYQPWVKKVILGSILEKSKVAPFLSPLILWTLITKALTHTTAGIQHLTAFSALPLCPIINHGQTTARPTLAFPWGSIYHHLL